MRLSRLGKDEVKEMAPDNEKEENHMKLPFKVPEPIGTITPAEMMDVIEKDTGQKWTEAGRRK
jgi:hypothetical protein